MKEPAKIPLPQKRPIAWIHTKAQVDADVEIGEGTRVWQFASVIRKAKIGKDCSIASCAIVDGSRIGHNVIVGHSAFIGPGATIGDNVFIGPHVTLCNDYWPKVTKEGWFDIDDLVSGDVVVTGIGSGSSIGAGVILMPGIWIGENVMVAAGAVVDRHVQNGNLFRRDGTIVPIDPDHLPNRMRSIGVAVC